MNAYDRAKKMVLEEQGKQKIIYCVRNVVGPTGPTGPQGEAASAVNILGSFTSLQDLENAYPVGNIGDAYLVGDDLYIWSSLKAAWLDIGCIRGPVGEEGPQGVQGPTGPTGPNGERGPQGIKGVQGPRGEIGPQGIPGETGPTGPRGIDGTSVTILGYYDSYSELVNAHPNGVPGNSYLVGDSLYVWSEETKTWQNVGMIRGPEGVQGKIGPTGPTGPKGEIGPQGVSGEQGVQGIPGPEGPIGPTGERGPQGIPGPLEIPSAMFVTTSEDLDSGGTRVEPGYSIPIANETLDTDNNFYFSNVNNTLTFYNSGLYRVDMFIQAKTTINVSAQPGYNIISVGLKKVGRDEPTIYVGNSIVGNTNTPTLLVATGYINLTYPNEWFEIVNTGKYPILVSSPDVEDTASESSFVSQAVNIFIQKIR